jgi:hypothetical protein
MSPGLYSHGVLDVFACSLREAALIMVPAGNKQMSIGDNYQGLKRRLFEAEIPTWVVLALFVFFTLH